MVGLISYPVLGFPLLIALAHNEPPTKVEDIVEVVNGRVAAIERLAYECNYKIKYVTDEDTTYLKGTCLFEMERGDTLLGFKTWIKKNDGYEHIYDLNHLYTVDHNEKKITVRDVSQHGVGAITGNIAKGLIFKALLEGIDLQQIEEDSAVVELVESVNSETHWVLQITYQDQGDITDPIKRIWINKMTLLPERMTFSAKLFDMTQFEELSVSGIRINQRDTSYLFDSLQLPNYEMIDYQPTAKVNLKPLTKGTEAPQFEIADMDGNVYKLSDLKGKLVLLDFWYMGCYPCIKALPHLEALHRKYAAQGLVVLGINSVDNDEDRPKLPKFISKHDVTYPILVANRSVDSSYHVRGYPTLYLVDKRGSIMYSQGGYNEQLKETLEQLIEPALR